MEKNRPVRKKTYYKTVSLILFIPYYLSGMGCNNYSKGDIYGHVVGQLMIIGIIAGLFHIGDKKGE